MVSEIIVLPIASEEANWLRLFSTEIHLWEELILAMLIHFDSKTIIAKVENLYYKVQLRLTARLPPYGFQKKMLASSLVVSLEALPMQKRYHGNSYLTLWIIQFCSL
ncbi:hypothetical protein MTR_8g015260 [Medicago truncatula]|uniref:Uncharacterized protein n=1 Tax=Medicago truncatula TaxID=3880 RepID=A0A072TLF9_MEDTR|nr:hypothetical protein MTR_8g015260 [Medicago truncatula]